MKGFKAGLALLLLAVLGGGAYAASVTTTFTFSSPASTSVTLAATSPCTLSGSTITCPLPITMGQQLATITVAPSGWNGSMSVSPSAPVCIGGVSPNYTAIACTDEMAGSTAVTFTANP